MKEINLLIRKTITALLVMFNILVFQAQSLELQSFSSVGDQLTSTTGISLSSILGEIASEELEESNLRLTQGFHQQFKIISHSNELKNTFGIILYPNPTLDIITLKSEEVDHKLMVHIYDSNGKQVSSSEFYEKTINLPFSAYPSGQYYAIVRDDQGKIIDQIPFQKISF